MEIFRQIEGHLQELENGQRATTRDFGLVREEVGSLRESVDRLDNRLDTMGKRSESMEAEMRWLRGAFASIEGL